MNAIPLASLPLCFGFAFVLVSACGSSSGNGAPATNTGEACQKASDCYAGLDAGSLQGAPLCLTAVTNGYCTHACTTDSNCCAIAGECPLAFPEVCAPFESTGGMDCFLSCESAAVMQAGFTDSTAFCQRYANATFICRSTGGGSNNRKVCVPN